MAFWAGAEPAQPVNRMMAHDGDEPAHHTTAPRIVVRCLPPHRDVALLQGVLRHFAPADGSQRDAK